MEESPDTTSRTTIPFGFGRKIQQGAISGLEIKMVQCFQRNYGQGIPHLHYMQYPKDWSYV